MKSWPTDLDMVIQTEAETHQTQLTLMEVSIPNKFDRRLRLHPEISTSTNESIDPRVGVILTIFY